MKTHIHDNTIGYVGIETRNGLYGGAPIKCLILDSNSHDFNFELCIEVSEDRAREIIQALREAYPDYAS